MISSEEGQGRNGKKANERGSERMISSPALITPLKGRLPLASSSRRAVPFAAAAAAAAASSSNHPHRIDTEQLRTQLDQLQAEAEKTRSKANSARLRLMRLTEAAENLQKRAVADVLVGKESESRELLIQKKKLMQALEKSKSRIEVLDKLSSKISEVISLKETQLIGHVAMDSGVSGKDSSQQVRFISPKYGDDEVSDKTNSICTDLTKSGQSKVPMTQECEANLPVDCQPNFEVSTGIVTSNDDNIISSLKDMSSCKDFLEHVDRQLRVVEIDLVEFIRLQSLKTENRQEQLNNKVQQISELLTEILSIRGRVVRRINARYMDYMLEQMMPRKELCSEALEKVVRRGAREGSQGVNKGSGEALHSGESFQNDFQCLAWMP